MDPRATPRNRTYAPEILALALRFRLHTRRLFSATRLRLFIERYKPPAIRGETPTVDEMEMVAEVGFEPTTFGL